MRKYFISYKTTRGFGNIILEREEPITCTKDIRNIESYIQKDSHEQTALMYWRCMEDPE